MRCIGLTKYFFVCKDHLTVW